MIYGLISDIHANIEAFDAVLAELASVEAFLCLGDLVGYGPDPGACIDRLRELPGLVCVAGNHDLAAVGRYDLGWFNHYARHAIEWTREQLTGEQQAYLSSLEPAPQPLAEAVLVHGALPEPMNYITTRQEAMDTFEAMPASSSLCFVGHTHVAEYYWNRKGAPFCDQDPLWDEGGLALEPGIRYILNPGSIGQPRDDDPRASFGLYDTEARTVRTRRVDYDVEAVQGKMRRAELPEYLVERLARGR